MDQATVTLRHTPPHSPRIPRLAGRVQPVKLSHYWALAIRITTSMLPLGGTVSTFIAPSSECRPR